MENTVVNKVRSNKDGQDCITLMFYTSDPEELIEEMQEVMKNTVREHNRESCLSRTVSIIVALTPEIQLNKDILVEQLNGMLPFYNEQFLEKNIGPAEGNSFEFVYSIEEDKPVNIQEETEANINIPEHNAKP